MKFTKTSMAVIAMAGLLAFSSSASAQTNAPPAGGRQGAGRQGGRGQGVEQQMTRLTEQLKLTDEQKPKVKAVLDEQDKKIMELRGNTGTAPEDRRAKLQSIREDSNKKLKEVLTAEQFTKYEELQRQQRGRRAGTVTPGGRGGTNAPGGGNRNRGGNAGGGQ